MEKRFRIMTTRMRKVITTQRVVTTHTITPTSRHLILSRTTVEIVMCSPCNSLSPMMTILATPAKTSARAPLLRPRPPNRTLTLDSKRPWRRSLTDNSLDKKSTTTTRKRGASSKSTEKIRLILSNTILLNFDLAEFALENSILTAFRSTKPTASKSSRKSVKNLTHSSIEWLTINRKSSWRREKLLSKKFKQCRKIKKYQNGKQNPWPSEQSLNKTKIRTWILDKPQWLNKLRTKWV